MKILSGFLFLLLFSLNSYGNINDMNETVKLDKEDIQKVEITMSTNSNNLNSNFYDSCTSTASGTATSSDGTVFHLTITVEGPCDHTLAQVMRDAIKKLRAEVAEL